MHGYWVARACMAAMPHGSVPARGGTQARGSTLHAASTHGSAAKCRQQAQPTAAADMQHSRPAQHGDCSWVHERTFWRPSSEVSTKNSTGSPSRRERKPSEMMAVCEGG